MKLTKRYGKILEQSFYDDEPDNVAVKLLGKLLIHDTGEYIVGGMITETEAYFGSEDPASRASKKGKIGEAMWREPGYTLIYMVHGNWLLNIVTTSGRPGAVLIRAVEPLIGIEYMRKLRGVYKKVDLTTGPGKLTKALGITKDHDAIPVFKNDSKLKIYDYVEIVEDEIGRSHRIGVTKDLPEKYRFYIKHNRYVSKG